MSDELTRTLLLEEVASRRRIADALYASVMGDIPLLTALVDNGATTGDILARYLARTAVPFLRQVAPVLELVDRLPPGLCARLLALPVRRDAITGTVDVVVAHPADPHAANEIAFHLGAPVRVVRAPVAAIEEALYRLRLRADSPVERFREAAAHAARELGDIAAGDEPLWDSRPRASEPPPTTTRDPRPRLDSFDDVRDPLPSLPPLEPELLAAVSFAAPSPEPSARRSLMIEPGSSVPPAPPRAFPHGTRVNTPAWGTPIHNTAIARSDPPSGYGSEIPIPLTRKTIGPAAALRTPSAAPGGTRRPPSLADQLHPRVPGAAPGLGEGYAFDGTGLRDIIERPLAPRIDAARIEGWARPLIGDSSMPAVTEAPPRGSFIPGPAPLPRPSSAPRLPFPDMGGLLAALRNAGSRDEVLELVLTASRMVALKVALFVVKKGGYQGWVGSPELGGRTALQGVLVPLEADSIFDRAVREDIYLGPLRADEVHAPLVRLLKSPSRDVAAVPIRVSGKTAVIILADELGDTMMSTRRLEELAKAAGDAFGRIVRARQR